MIGLVESRPKDGGHGVRVTRNHDSTRSMWKFLFESKACVYLCVLCMREGLREVRRI